MVTTPNALSAQRIVELLELGDVVELVRAVRPIAVDARQHPAGYDRPQIALLTDLARIKRNDPVLPPVPDTALPALVHALQRESPSMSQPWAQRVAQALLDQLQTRRSEVRS